LRAQRSNPADPEAGRRPYDPPHWLASLGNLQLARNDILIIFHYPFTIFNSREARDRNALGPLFAAARTP
jgi:hypothetical protein